MVERTARHLFLDVCPSLFLRLKLLPSPLGVAARVLLLRDRWSEAQAKQTKV